LRGKAPGCTPPVDFVYWACVCLAFPVGFPLPCSRVGSLPMFVRTPFHLLFPTNTAKSIRKAVASGILMPKKTAATRAELTLGIGARRLCVSADCRQGGAELSPARSSSPPAALQRRCSYTESLPAKAIRGMRREKIQQTERRVRKEEKANRTEIETLGFRRIGFSETHVRRLLRVLGESSSRHCPCGPLVKPNSRSSFASCSRRPGCLFRADDLRDASIVLPQNC